MASLEVQTTLQFPSRRLRPRKAKASVIEESEAKIEIRSDNVLKTPTKRALAKADHSSSPSKSPRRALAEKFGESNAVAKEAIRISPRKSSKTSDQNDENVAPIPAFSPRKTPRKSLNFESVKPEASPRKSPRKNLETLLASKSGDEEKVTPIPSTPKSCSQPQTPTSVGKSLFLRQSNQRFVKARQSLSIAVPDEIVGRKTEIETMKHFLENAWKGGKKPKRSLYVSGAPGTGKTACLKHLLTTLKFAKPVHEIFINCMSLKSASDIYQSVAKSLDPKYDGKQAKKFVEAKICAKMSKQVLLILDEIDQLDSKDQEVLYTLFEWPYFNKSSLVLIGIANSLDLTDRVLPRLKLSASAVPQQLSFPAYSRQQINDIIVSRLKATTDGQDESDKCIIKPAAIKFLAGKIAAISGDVRKALDVCRRAIEMAEYEYKKQTVLSPGAANQGKSEVLQQVDLPQVLRIFNQIYASRVSASVQTSGSDHGLPLQQKVLMAGLLLMTKYGQKKCKEVTMGKLHETFGKICRKRKMAALDISEVSSLCSLLETRGYLSVRKGKTPRDVKISLRIDEKEVEEALKDKTMLSDIVQDTSCIAA